MHVTLNVPSFNFKFGIDANQIDIDKEMIELKLGHGKNTHIKINSSLIIINNLRRCVVKHLFIL